MDSITVQYLIAVLAVVLGLCGLLPPTENMKLARMFGAVMLAAGVLVGFATMAFGDLELF